MERISGGNKRASKRVTTHTKRSTTEDLPTAASPRGLVTKSEHARAEHWVRLFFEDIPRRTSLTCTDLSD